MDGGEYNIPFAFLTREYMDPGSLTPVLVIRRGCLVRPIIETGRVRQSAVIHCQIRLVYSKSGVIAYVRFTRATN